MKTIIKVLKLIVGLLISLGVGALVKNLLVMITPPGAKFVIRISMMVAGYFLAGLAAKATTEAMEVKIDQTVLQIEKVIKLIEERQGEIDSVLKEA